MNQAIVKLLRLHGADPKSFKAWRKFPRVVSGDVPTANALELWRAIRTEFDSTGVWPVIRGEALDREDPFGPDPKKALKGIPAGTIDELLAPALAERIESFQEDIPNLAMDCNVNALVSKADKLEVMSSGGKGPRAKKWPTKRAKAEFVVNTVESSETMRHASLRFSLIELTHPFEAPACLGFGGWNQAPRPEMQSAVLREWERAYGAVPVAMNGDVLECFVERPPKVEADAMHLAAQQWLFCYDIVSQGTQTVRNLAIELWRSPRWFFWWD